MKTKLLNRIEAMLGFFLFLDS